MVAPANKRPLSAMRPILAAIAVAEDARARRWLSGRLALLPDRWAAFVAAEHARRGGLESPVANAWLGDVTAAGECRVPLAAGDGELRALAKRCAKEAVNEGSDRFWQDRRALMARVCRNYGIEPAGGAHDAPAVARMGCPVWWLRRLRRAHGRRAEGAAIGGGVVRRGLWPYASQDAIERRAAQKARNAKAAEKAVIECERSGEQMALAEVIAGSVANPANKRIELMTRVRACDAMAHDSGAACEFWTVTCPSRFHAQRVTGAVAEPNPAYDGSTPGQAQAYICKVWARARAAWERRGLVVWGLRTAEPHHDGCPHWHVVAYGSRRDLRFARRLLRVYALRDMPDEAGARRHRFTVLTARGAIGARYAAKYVAKNIDGANMEGERDTESGRKVSSAVKRVDAWAATWGIRQFQFFGAAPVTAWRVLRRVPGQAGSRLLERARQAADDGDFAEYWRCWIRGKFKLLREAGSKMTQYGDAAAARIVGVAHGAARALLDVKEWVIHWGGRKGAEVFDFPRSGVNNCTRRAVSAIEDAALAVFGIGDCDRRLRL